MSQQDPAPITPVRRRPAGADIVLLLAQKAGIDPYAKEQSVNDCSPVMMKGAVQSAWLHTALKNYINSLIVNYDAGDKSHRFSPMVWPELVNMNKTELFHAFYDFETRAQDQATPYRLSQEEDAAVRQSIDMKIKSLTQQASNMIPLLHKLDGFAQPREPQAPVQIESLMEKAGIKLGAKEVWDNRVLIIRGKIQSAWVQRAAGNYFNSLLIDEQPIGEFKKFSSCGALETNKRELEKALNDFEMRNQNSAEPRDMSSEEKRAIREANKEKVMAFEKVAKEEIARLRPEYLAEKSYGR